jgi:hypothetical protein
MSFRQRQETEMRKLLLITLVGMQLSAVAAEKKTAQVEEREPAAVRVHESKDVHDEQNERAIWSYEQRREFHTGEMAKY